MEEFELATDYEANFDLGLQQKFQAPLKLLTDGIKSSMKNFDNELKNDKWKGVLANQAKLPSLKTAKVEELDVCPDDTVEQNLTILFK